jgi:phosphate transport system protein
MEASTTPNRPQVVQRSALAESLAEAERSTLAELETVRTMLRRSVAAAVENDSSAAGALAEQSRDLERRYEEVHDRLLSLIACQAPVAGDLRLAMALLHVNDRIARMGAQCLNIATLCAAMEPGECPSASQLSCLAAMSELVDEQVESAQRVFAERDVTGARGLREHDQGINDQNRHCFELSVEDGDCGRKAAFFVAMMARALERIGDNAVDIGQQAAFVETGRLHGTPIG